MSKCLLRCSEDLKGRKKRGESNNGLEVDYA